MKTRIDYIEQVDGFNFLSVHYKSGITRYVHLGDWGYTLTKSQADFMSSGYKLTVCNRIYWIHLDDSVSGALNSIAWQSCRDANLPEAVRDLAIDWQCTDADRSYADLLEWAEFFERAGSILGLYDEFKENGII